MLGRLALAFAQCNKDITVECLYPFVTDKLASLTVYLHV